MKKTLKFFIFFVFFPIFTFGCSNSQVEVEKYIIVNNKKIIIELADSEAEKIKGLSKRAELKSNEGMLFVYNDYKIRNFWMKDMLFPIDIVWIKDNKIIGIEKNLQPETGDNLKIYKSPIPVNYVLEINSGFCDQNNIKDGDYLNINL